MQYETATYADLLEHMDRVTSGDFSVEPAVDNQLWRFHQIIKDQLDAKRHPAAHDAAATFVASTMACVPAGRRRHYALQVNNHIGSIHASELAERAQEVYNSLTSRVDGRPLENYGVSERHPLDEELASIHTSQHPSRWIIPGSRPEVQLQCLPQEVSAQLESAPTRDFKGYRIVPEDASGQYTER
jgi:hypothetical protein